MCAFQALNNIPKDILLFSYDEVEEIVKTLKTAQGILSDEGDEERLSIVEPIAESFDTFFTDWTSHKEQSGSLFANEKTV